MKCLQVCTYTLWNKAQFSSKGTQSSPGSSICSRAHPGSEGLILKDVPRASRGWGEPAAPGSPPGTARSPAASPAAAMPSATLTSQRGRRPGAPHPPLAADEQIVKLQNCTAQMSAGHAAGWKRAVVKSWSPSKSSKTSQLCRRRISQAGLKFTQLSKRKRRESDCSLLQQANWNSFNLLLAVLSYKLNYLLTL